MEHPETDDTLDGDLSFYQYLLSTTSFPGVALRTMDNAGNKTFKKTQKNPPHSPGASIPWGNTETKQGKQSLGVLNRAFFSIGWSGKSSKR